MTLPRGSTAETRRILEFWLLLFWMVTCDTWDGEAGDRGEEDDLTDDADLCEDELQLLAPLDPRPSRISLRALLTCSHWSITYHTEPGYMPDTE